MAIEGRSRRLWVRNNQPGTELPDGRSTWYSIERPIGDDAWLYDYIIECNKRPLGPNQQRAGYNL